MKQLILAAILFLTTVSGACAARYDDCIQLATKSIRECQLALRTEPNLDKSIVDGYKRTIASDIAFIKDVKAIQASEVKQSK